MIDANLFPSGGIFVPSKISNSPWLLIALHGSEGSAENFIGLDKALKIPELNFLYLNGPICSYSNYRWYDLDARTGVDYLTTCINDVIDSGFNPETIFLMGFSQGAAVVMEFGALYSKTLAGYISISGRIENLSAILAQGKPKGSWLVTHGSKDYNLSPEIAEEQAAQLVKAGYNVSFKIFDKIHEFDAREELPFIANWITHHMY